MFYNINATEGVNEVLKHASSIAEKYNNNEIIKLVLNFITKDFICQQK